MRQQDVSYLDNSPMPLDNWEAFNANLGDITGTQNPATLANSANLSTQASFGFGEGEAATRIINSAYRNGAGIDNSPQAKSKAEKKQQQQQRSLLKRLTITDCEQVLADLDQKIADIGEQIKLHQTRLVEIDGEIETLTEDAQELESDIFKTEDELNDSREAVSEAETKLETAQTDYEEACDKRDAMQEEVEHASNPISSLIARVKQETADRAVEEAEQELAQREIELQESIISSNYLEEKLAQQTEELQDIEQQISILRAERQDVEAEIAGLVEEQNLLIQERESVLEQQARHEARIKTDPEYAARVANDELTVADSIKNLPDDKQIEAKNILSDIAKEGGEAYDKFIQNPIKSLNTAIGKVTGTMVKTAGNAVGVVKGVAGGVTTAVTRMFSKPVNTPTTTTKTASVDADGGIEVAGIAPKDAFQGASAIPSPATIKAAASAIQAPTPAAAPTI